MNYLYVEFVSKAGDSETLVFVAPVKVKKTNN